MPLPFLQSTAFLLLLATLFKESRQVGLGFTKNGYLQTGHIHLHTTKYEKKKDISIDTKINFFIQCHVDKSMIQKNK